MKFGFSSVWRSVAVSALLNAAMPVAEAWAAEEIQVLRRAPSSAAIAMPFTTFQQEELALSQSLPCKWISKDGRVGPSYGGGRYDYLCKGGDFATVNLYLDKTGGDGVGRVRLMYREWNAAVNPNAGEAKIAMQFLQHVTGRFVPATAAGQTMDSFWGQKNRKWVQDGVEITFDLEKGKEFNVRRLTLEPKEGKRSLGAAPVVGGGLAKPGVAPVQATVPVYIQTPDGVKKPVQDVTPIDAGLTKQPVLPVAPSVVLPTVPAGVLPVPGVGVPKLNNGLIVPPLAPAGPRADETPKLEQPGKLEQASPAELHTAPAPETRVTPTAVGTPSSSLVPSSQDTGIGGPVRAPSNFDVYNKAMELTKDVEAKAQIQKVEEAKVTASKPVATEAAPSLKPVPTPGEAAAATTGGLGVPAVQATPKVEDVGQPTNYQGPRRTEARPLPQLKFVPKAEPLRTPNEVIQFEDEKSRL